MEVCLEFNLAADDTGLTAFVMAYVFVGHIFLSFSWMYSDMHGPALIYVALLVMRITEMIGEDQ